MARIKKTTVSVKALEVGISERLEELDRDLRETPSGSHMSARIDGERDGVLYVRDLLTTLTATLPGKGKR